MYLLLFILEILSFRIHPICIAHTPLCRLNKHANETPFISEKPIRNLIIPQRGASAEMGKIK